uniref:Uncharacterized protein n=1 Tax=Oryza glumipatula TaxID=40148 RepID=A0A0D9YMK6_9ORYZ
MRRKDYSPAETNPCNVMIPQTTLLLSTTGKNCTGEGGDSIFSMACTAIASAKPKSIIRNRDKEL